MRANVESDTISEAQEIKKEDERIAESAAAVIAQAMPAIVRSLQNPQIDPSLFNSFNQIPKIDPSLSKVISELPPIDSLLPKLPQINPELVGNLNHLGLSLQNLSQNPLLKAIMEGRIYPAGQFPQAWNPLIADEKEEEKHSHRYQLDQDLDSSGA